MRARRSFAGALVVFRVLEVATGRRATLACVALEGEREACDGEGVGGGEDHVKTVAAGAQLDMPSVHACVERAKSPESSRERRCTSGIGPWRLEPSM